MTRPYALTSLCLNWTPHHALPPVGMLWRSRSLSSLAAAILLAPALALAGNTWTGGGSSPFNWSDTANWGGAAPAYGTITFSGTAGTVNTLNGNFTSAGNANMNQVNYTGTSTWTMNNANST